jgi:hypothetical protein
LISKTLERALTYKSGALTLDGGNSSSTQENLSLIFRTTTFLMLAVVKMKNTETLLYGRDMEEPTRDGRSSMLTKQKRFKPRELLETSASMPTDHSTLDQDFQ